ncbi:MAG: hypothetical protein LBM08_10110 [Dysgonamonadaceae bacterium]|jgi:hypothetical protein|nr:hypothetical protein [Dysgonamonadaceae bacterium]
MKRKKILSVFAGLFLLASPVFVSCDFEEDDTKVRDRIENGCHEDGHVFCDYEGDYGCCGSETPWTDGHGTCYNSQSYCRGSGWSCVHCR